MTTTAVTVQYGGLEIPTYQTVRVMLPGGHKVHRNNQLVDAGTVLVFAVHAKPAATRTNANANLFLMSPGLPQMVGGCYVFGKARGRAKWVEYDGCRTVEEWVERFVCTQYIHLTDMPAGFTVVEAA